MFMYSILGGIVALLLSIWGFVSWWYIFVDIFKGVVPLLLLIFGIMALVAGIKQMQRENLPTKKVEKAEES
ncbi:MAG: hypothetical protein HQM15_07350 [Deltaproteobacteria bacterium]|nr:hypothetical protein [Deltaproteobacteria bacterium]